MVSYYLNLKDGSVAIPLRNNANGLSIIVETHDPDTVTETIDASLSLIGLARQPRAEEG